MIKALLLTTCIEIKIMINTSKHRIKNWFVGDLSLSFSLSLPVSVSVSVFSFFFCLNVGETLKIQNKDNANAWSAEKARGCKMEGKLSL